MISEWIRLRQERLSIGSTTIIEITRPAKSIPMASLWYDCLAKAIIKGVVTATYHEPSVRVCLMGLRMAQQQVRAREQ